MGLRVLLTLATMTFVLAGCERYRAKPLDPSSVLSDVERSRRLQQFAAEGESPAAANVQPAFTFMRAVELTRTHSPALKEVWAEYQTALAPAGIKTPLPNPAVEAGPQFGFGPEVSPATQFGAFGSIGFAIPTGRRLKRQDELNRARADAAHAEYVIRARELYLELRRQYSLFVLSHARIRARRDIADSAQKSTASTKRLIEAGSATALDAGLIELEQGRLQAETFSAEGVQAETSRNLSRLIGVHTEHFAPLPEDSTPQPPDKVPDIAELRELLVNNHPGLARLRARYEIAERQLRLEVAKQYPDFKIGPSFNRDAGDRKNVFGLTLGIDLPIFDRNQQAVATALKTREEMRTRYESEMNRALADLDHAWRLYQLSAEKLKLVKTVLLPRARKNIDLARKSIEAGAADSLRVIETERGERAMLLEALETEFSVREAWISLEQAIGISLFLFPSETNAPASLPDALRNEDKEETK